MAPGASLDDIKRSEEAEVQEETGAETSAGCKARPVSIAESQLALKVSFNRPRPRSQPARAVCAGCLFFFTAVHTLMLFIGT